MLQLQAKKNQAFEIPQSFTLRISWREFLVNVSRTSLSNFGARKQLLWDLRQLYFLLNI